MEDILNDSQLVEDFAESFSPRNLRKKLSETTLNAPPSAKTVTKEKQKPKFEKRASMFSELFFMESIDDTIRKKGQGVTIFGMLEFANKLDIDKLKLIITERLFEIPRFCCMPREDKEKKCVNLVRLQPDQMDMDYHLEEVEQDKPWTQQQLNDYASKLYETGWTTEFPPWKVLVFQEMEDGPSIVAIALHHGLADGTAATAALMSMLDEPPEGEVQSRQVPLKKRPPPAVPLLKKVRAVTSGVKEALFGMMLPADKPNPIKIKDHRNPSMQKTLSASSTIDLAELKKVKEQFGHATVTDVLLSLLTMTIKKYFDEHGGSYPTSVRGNFPISLRASGTDVLHESMGNKMAFGKFRFNLNYKTPEEVVFSVMDQANDIKVSPGPMVEHWLQGKLGPYLVSQGTEGRVKLMNLGLDAYGKVSAMLSSNMGPQTQVYLAGQAVTGMRFYGLAPIGVYFGIVSYNGQVSLGVVSDATLGQASDIEKHWIPAWKELKAAAAKYPGQIPAPKPKHDPAELARFGVLFALVVCLLLSGYPKLAMVVFCVGFVALA